MEHLQSEIPSYPILLSQKATLLIIQYHFTIHPASQLLFLPTIYLNNINYRIKKYKKNLLSLSSLFIFVLRLSVFLSFSSTHHQPKPRTTTQQYMLEPRITLEKFCNHRNKISSIKPKQNTSNKILAINPKQKKTKKKKKNKLP